MIPKTGRINLRQHKRKFTDYQVIKVNKVRKAFGLSQMIVKERTCLRCEATFDAYGDGNRLCDACNRYVPTCIDWGVKINAKGG